MENKIIVDVQQKGMESAYAELPFDQAKEALEKEGYHIASLQENARLRMQEGKDSDVSKYTNYTREGVLCVPRKGVFLTRKSPIMANVKQAIECHRNNQDFYLTDEQVEESLEDSVELVGKRFLLEGYIPLTSIPTTGFGEDETTRYAFGEDAERYGNFLKEAGIDEINKMSVRLIDSLVNVSDKPFAIQMFFVGLRYHNDEYGGGLFDVAGKYWTLNDKNRLRGVRNSAEGTEKSLEVYTSAQLEDALNTLGLPDLSKSLVDKLREE